MPDYLVGPLVGDIQGPQHLRHFICIGAREEIGGRALQHGDVFALAGHGRNDGGGRGAGADNQHLHVAVVQVLRPQLRVHDPALVAVHAGPFRSVGVVMVVVALAHPQEAGREGELFASLQVVHQQLPALLRAAPAGGADLVAIADVVAQPLLLDTLGEVLEDFRGRGDGGSQPGLPTVTESVQVAV